MDFQPRRKDWRSILLLIFSLSGIALTITVAISTLVLVAVTESSLAELSEINTSPLATVLAASALFSFGILLIPIAWLSLQRLRGREFSSFSFPVLRPWALIAILGLWFLVLILAAIFYDRQSASWYIPWLHFLSIALPIYIIIRTAINRISIGSSQRAWGVFGSGMTLSPVLSVIAEIIILGFGFLIFAVYMGLNPEKLSGIERLINQIENAPDLNSVMYLIGPYLGSPLIILTALMFLSVFVPIIEELAKSVGIWLVADRITSPAQGFGLGVLSGAGFALAESLFSTISPDETWALALSMRALSGSMHMLASGLAGWGIAYARLEKRYLRAFGMTVLAMLLHGAWNAGAVLAVAGGLRLMLTISNIDIFGTLLMLGGVGLIFVLASSMFLAFTLINRILRNSSRPISISVDQDNKPHITAPK